MSDLQLKIRVIQASGLQRGDKNSSDPFVVAKFRGLGKMMTSVQTSVIHNTLNPVWNQDLTLYPKNVSDVLLLKVYDHDTLSKDNLLGMVEVPLDRFFQQGWQDNWIQLMSRKGSWKSLIGGHPTWISVPGQIHVQFWFGLSSQATGLASLSLPYATNPLSGQTANSNYSKEVQTFACGWNPVSGGLNQGYQTGFQQPLNQGLNQGSQQQYNQPLNQGLNQGFQQPFNQPLNQGLQQGTQPIIYESTTTTTQTKTY
jgi:hypothetical protein